MKGSDRMILVALPLVALAVGFWLLVIGPKRSEVSDLDKQAETLTTRVAAAESQVAAAEESRDAFDANYADLVSLGAAVPEGEDQATLLHNLSGLARRSDVSLRGFTLAPDGAVPAAPAPAPAPAATEPSATAPTDAQPVAAPATEASAAALPLGATVGPAGLPVTPYSLKYFGDFFDTADLFEAIDSRVDVGEGNGEPVVNGRLMTIDGFAMSADPVRGFPRVQTEISVTTYLVPAEQGIDAGATATGPDPAATTTAATTTAPATAAPTAAVTP